MRESIIVAVEADTKKFDAGVTKVKRDFKALQVTAKETKKELGGVFDQPNRISRVSTVDPRATQVAAAPSVAALEAAKDTLLKALELGHVPIKGIPESGAL